MKLHKPIVFLFQSVTVGLAVAFLVLVWRPELFNRDRVVKIVEGVSSAAGISSRAASGPYSYAEAVERAAPAVVNIYSRKMVTDRAQGIFDDPIFRHFFGDQIPDRPREREETSLGSGVIVNPQGYILTNNHVIEGAEQIKVGIHDGRNAPAQVIGTDPEADLAVLKVNLKDLPAVTLGDSDHLRVGDVVLAIGNPFGVGQTVTMGIVSATGRKELGISTFENFIQTDAAINPGNSGGALITATGELVGINTAIFTRTGGSQGIGFAIPVSLAKGIMTEIIEKGRVTRGWLGIEIQAITPELAESFGLSQPKGVIVAGVLRDGPAARAGLRPGDVITQVSGKPVNDVRTALNTISSVDPGKRVQVSAIREGKRIQLDIAVAERPVHSTAQR